MLGEESVEAFPGFAVFVGADKRFKIKTDMHGF
jgi:hypothetical protein